MRYSRLFYVLLPVLLLLFFLLPQVLTTAHAAPVPVDPGSLFAYYEETGHNVSFEVKAFYDAHGGPDIFGLPLTEVVSDTEPGLRVQYFERARLELHPDLPPEHRISISRAGSLLTEGRTDEAFQWLAQSPDPERDFFPASGHTLGGAFRYYWQTHGGITVFGYPISEEFTEINPVDNQPYLVQYFERARFEYHPEKQGTPYEVQTGHLGTQLLDQHPRAQEMRQRARPITLLGSATTSYAASINERRHNIARATEMFNGLIVQPGETFSFNSISDFTAEEGFVSGYAIMGGRLERVIAGGLCQVSTTFFRAVSNAGLEVVERHPHTYVVNFYENILGFDATVYDPEVDFRWRNDTNGPVYVSTRANPEQATVTFWLWGHSDGRQVSYEGPYTKNWRRPGAAIWEYDPNLPRGAVRQLVHGRSGVDVTYIRTVTMPDGSLLRKDNFFTRYLPWADFYVYGPGAR